MATVLMLIGLAMLAVGLILMTAVVVMLCYRYWLIKCAERVLELPLMVWHPFKEVSERFFGRRDSSAVAVISILLKKRLVEVRRAERCVCDISDMTDRAWLAAMYFTNRVQCVEVRVTYGGGGRRKPPRKRLWEGWFEPAGLPQPA